MTATLRVGVICEGGTDRVVLRIIVVQVDADVRKLPEVEARAARGTRE